LLPASLEERFFIMAIDIKALIRGRREARAEGIEELARRLASGEAVAPEEIEAHLERTGVDEEVLQARVDALERRDELLATAAKGTAARAKVEKIENDIGVAWEAVAVAQRKHAALREKHADDLLALRQAVAAADRAGDELLDPANLSPLDRDRLAAARKAASDAASALGEVRRNLPSMRMSLENAERVLVDAAEQARLNKSNADIQENRARAENSVKARKGRLAEAEAELPRLQAAAQAAEAAVVALEDELRR
jgi:hypothetical protein